MNKTTTSKTKEASAKKPAAAKKAAAKPEAENTSVVKASKAKAKPKTELKNKSDLKDKSVQELNAFVTEKLKEQFNLRVQRAAGQPIKSHQFKVARRDIARAKTVLASKGGK